MAFFCKKYFLNNVFENLPNKWSPLKVVTSPPPTNFLAPLFVIFLCIVDSNIETSFFRGKFSNSQLKFCLEFRFSISKLFSFCSPLVILFIISDFFFVILWFFSGLLRPKNAIRTSLLHHLWVQRGALQTREGEVSLPWAPGIYMYFNFIQKNNFLVLACGRRPSRWRSWGPWRPSWRK